MDQNNSFFVDKVNLEAINQLVKDKLKYNQFIEHRKKCYKCISRQICSLASCPKNYFDVSETKQLNYWCDNMQFYREEIISYLVRGDNI